MKSPMIEANPVLTPKEMVSAEFNTGAVKNGYTDLQVLQSGGGFYIGTLYEEYDATGKCVWQEPGSRDSDYFGTKEGAAAYLKVLQVGSDEDAAEVLRQHP